MVMVVVFSLLSMTLCWLLSYNTLMLLMYVVDVCVIDDTHCDIVVAIVVIGVVCIVDVVLLLVGVVLPSLLLPIVLMLLFVYVYVGVDGGNVAGVYVVHIGASGYCVIINVATVVVYAVIIAYVVVVVIVVFVCYMLLSMLMWMALMQVRLLLSFVITLFVV